jgi:hypothetical protein
MTTTWSLPSGRCRIGIGRVDITPPSDSYHRNWGAALHDAAEGIHRPLFASALMLAATDNNFDKKILVMLDLGWLRTREMRLLLQQSAAAADIEQDDLVITFSHTHAAINLDVERSGEAGGEHIRPYLAALPEKIAQAISAAAESAEFADLSTATGSCDLAWQRDYWDAERGLYTCGPNPQAAADATLLITRATRADGTLLFHLINYACHPTTLAWENRLISPDYIGAMREVVEQQTGAPCLFALGACGELGPRDGFVGDIATAERNGRQLGYAALSAAESLPAPATHMRYEGPLLSGATLGLWSHAALEQDQLEAAALFQSTRIDLRLPTRPAPDRDDLLAQLAQWQQKAASAGDDLAILGECRARSERLNRALRRLEEDEDDGETTYSIHLWRVGACVFVLVGGEPYNLLQRELRRRFPATALVFAVLCNEPHSYVLPREECGKGLYQDSCATLAPGALEQIVASIDAQLHEWDLH